MDSEPLAYANSRLEDAGKEADDEENREKSTAEESGQLEHHSNSVGFWDPRLKHVRRDAVLKWCLTTLILMTSILGILSLFWALFSHLPENISSLGIYIVDFDGRPPYENNGIAPFVGPMFTELTRQLLQSPQPALGYEFPHPAQFNDDPMQVRQAVFDFKAWAAIIINANATALLSNAIQTGNSSYDPNGACQIIYSDSRDSNTYATSILPELTALQIRATATIGNTWARMILQNISSDPRLQVNVRNAPQGLTPAIGFSVYNLRPFYPAAATPGVSIGLIYLIILSFFSFSFYLPIHAAFLRPQGHPPLKRWQLRLWRWLTTVLAYLFLSLAYSLLSLAFGLNFSGSDPVPDTSVASIINGNSNVDAYGRATFVVYWMINFWGMMALGLPCENVSMVVGQPWTGLWLIFWVIMNVSTALYDIDLSPGFYRWGYAWPLHNIVEASRQTLFGLHSRIGLNFGVLIAWGAVNTTLFPWACAYMSWKGRHNVHEYYA